jgi:hypothetical protein
MYTIKRELFMSNMYRNMNGYNSVQLIGAFNTGTNLLAKVISKIFDTTIHPEGHTNFWKHTTITDNFDLKSTPNILYIVISKHPYFWFHSVYKRQYTIKTEKTIHHKISVGEYIKQPIVLGLPGCVRTNPNITTFTDFVDYYNKLYNGTRQYLPQKNTIFIQYEQFISNPMESVLQLSKVLRVRGYQHLNLDKNKDLQRRIEIILKGILSQPTKSHGNPKHGVNATQWYSKSNIPKLFNDADRNWIDTRLDNELIDFLKY